MPEKAGIQVTTEDIRALVSALELAQTHSYVDLTPQVFYADVDSAPFAPFVTLSTRFEDLQAGLQYTALVATDLKLDPFFLYRILQDSFGVTETFSLIREYGAAFEETYAVLDGVSLAVSLTLSSAFLLDDMESVDALTIQTGIRKTNAVFAADVLTLNYAKITSDSFSIAAEIVEILFATALLDIIVVADTFLLELAFVPTAILNAAPLNTFTLNE